MEYEEPPDDALQLGDYHAMSYGMSYREEYYNIFPGDSRVPCLNFYRKDGGSHHHFFMLKPEYTLKLLEYLKSIEPQIRQDVEKRRI